MREGLGNCVVWYSLKYDRREVIQLGRDVDVEKLIKGNEEYPYVYMVGDEGTFVREVQVGVVNRGILMGGHRHLGGWTEDKQKWLLMLIKCNVVVML